MVCVRMNVTLSLLLNVFIFYLCEYICLCEFMCTACMQVSAEATGCQTTNFSDVVVNHLLKRVGVNPGPLQEQGMLLSTEQSSQS